MLKPLEGKSYIMTINDLQHIVLNAIDGKDDIDLEDMFGFDDWNAETKIITDLKQKFNDTKLIIAFQEWVSAEPYDDIEIEELIVGLMHMKQLPCFMDNLIIEG